MGVWPFSYLFNFHPWFLTLTPWVKLVIYCHEYCFISLWIHGNEFPFLVKKTDVHRGRLEPDLDSGAQPDMSIQP